MDREIAIIHPTDRDSSGNLLPEIRDRVMEDIEYMISDEKSLNVMEMSRKLGLTWITTAGYVKDITDRWRKQDEFKLQKYRKHLVELAEQVLKKSDEKAKTDTFTIDDLHQMMDLFRDIVSLVDIQDNGVKSGDDASKIVSLHFTGMNITPDMASDIIRVKSGEARKIVEQEPTSVTTIVKEQEVSPIVNEPEVEEHPTEIPNPFLNEDGGNNTTGPTGDGNPVI